MRIFLLAALFAAIIIGMFYLLDPTEGRITKQNTLSPQTRDALKKLPRP